MNGADSKDDFCFLNRLMIDGKYQGKGFGRRALKLVVENAKSNLKLKRIITSYREGSGGPGGFYKKFGFTPIADIDSLGELGQQIKKFGEVALEYRF